MKEIKTRSGFVCTLPEDALDDMELVEVFAAEFENESYRNVAIIKHLMPDQREEMYAHLRSIHGKVPASAVNQELIDIIRGLGESGKNS